MTALPTFIAAGNFGSLTPSLPTGWAEGDIFLLVAETSGDPLNIPDGWLEVPPSSIDVASTERLTVLWRRATASESSPTLTNFGDHVFASIMAFRGCAIRGNPWNKIAGGIDSSSNTTRTAGGFTTDVNNCLVVCIQSDGRDVGGATLSAWANADLASITEIFDTWSTAGGGGGWGAATGTKVTAGSVGNTTATSTGSATSGWITIALKPAGEEDALVYAGPYFVARGTVATCGANSSATPGLPTGWADHDVFILLCESGKTITAPSGWQEIPNSPQSITALSILTGFWRRAGTSESAPSVALGALGDHLICQIAAFRGCHPEGNPWDVQAGGTDTVSDSTANVGSGTVTSDNALVLTIIATGADTATPQTTLWAPHDEGTDAINYYVALNSWTTTGGGGGIACVAWEMIHAGTFAARSAQIFTAANTLWILLGLKAGPGPLARHQIVWLN